MEKDEIKKILYMSFRSYLEKYGKKYGIGSQKCESIPIYACRLNDDDLYNIDSDKARYGTVREFLRYSKQDWESFKGMGNSTVSKLEKTLAHNGLHFGMTEEDIARLEGNTDPAANQSDDPPALSFQDYINNLKLFADNAGAYAIENEVVTDDGYKITIKIQKIK